MTTTNEDAGDVETCAACGTAITVDVTGFDPTMDIEHNTMGSVIAEERCTNPDCPTNDSDLAPIAEGESF